MWEQCLEQRAENVARRASQKAKRSHSTSHPAPEGGFASETVKVGQDYVDVRRRTVKIARILDDDMVLVYLTASQAGVFGPGPSVRNSKLEPTITLAHTRCPLLWQVETMPW